ncbi:3-isopropylmalate dehydratase [Allopusillimonas soli]|uniref:3-isopropylmalate dehydratase n=1 Tax=Allopusillimonas soli TaxID=659016 RepID=A0A853F9U6_9BURK|nr:3-isopropylmalate dehydratase [Allopusillimonas soli]NYT37465.1 3-isopropylmalate dehydratase [Allopusillimonas soli]TEA74555.1 3-isopropylmalate dehydratase [Allopusillimonas soli]
MTQRHRVWRVGENIDTDALAPGAYMKLDLQAMASHCLENHYPGLAAAIRPGDVLVAGHNFGIGSSREQAAGVLVQLGVKAVVAPSFSGLYFRNAFNLGLLAVVCADADRIPEGSEIEIDTDAAVIRVFASPTRAAGTSHSQDGNAHPDPASARVLACQKIPDFLANMAKAGGLLAQLQQQLAHTTP